MLEKYEYRAMENGQPLLCQFFIKKNFLSKESCNLLIDYYRKYAEEQKLSKVDGFFDNRVIWYTYINNAPDVKKIMQETKENTINLIKNFYNLSHEIYGDSIQLVSWPEGLGMGAHYDNRHPNKEEPHPTPWRDYAGVIYLNDDYRDGELIMASANPSLLVKPEQGMLIVFGGGDGFMHGVRPAYGNTRYTMPCWFTSDITKKELETTHY